MTTDQHKTVSTPPAALHRKPVAKVLFISALTSVFVVMIWHFQTDSLSAEEQQLVGTWRRFDADGKHIRDERYRVDRSYEERNENGLFVEHKRKLWSLSGGIISFALPVPVSDRILSWSDGRHLSLGSFSFPSEETSDAWWARNLPYGLYHYSDVKFIGPEPILGETVHVKSQEFPNEVHTLRRLLSEEVPGSKDRMVE